MNEKDWYRLRVGFFSTRADALETGQKIKDLLGISEIWAAETEDDEFREFGGY
ncbi:SPOR domain-containing protein [Thermodesulfobacteriota bacterium]